MLQPELAQLEEQVHRLIAAFHQMRLERKHALQERDRLQTRNAELKKHIEGTVERLRRLEASISEDSAT